MHHILKNLCDFFLFILAITLGKDWAAHFIHWIATGSLPPWFEQLCSLIPGIVVAWYHIKTSKKKRQDSTPDYTKLKK